MNNVNVSFTLKYNIQGSTKDESGRTSTLKLLDSILTMTWSLQFNIRIIYDDSGCAVHDMAVPGLISPGLHILKEWDSSEEEIIKQAYAELLAPGRRERFEPIGNNSCFEGTFLKSKLLKFGVIGSNGKSSFRTPEFG